MMRAHRLLVLTIVILGLLAYANAFHGSYQYDDVLHIVENRAIQDLGNLPQILFGPRGLAMASFALNYAFGGLDVFGYHVVNIGLHLLNAVLVYFFLLHLLAARGEADDDGGVQSPQLRLAAFAALFFVVHPLHTQAVNLIVQRMELLASTFYLLGMLLFIIACRAATRRRQALFFSLVVVSYVLGLKSKEIAVTLPAAIILYDYFFVAGSRPARMLVRWPVHAVLGSICIWFVAMSLSIESSQAVTAALTAQGKTAAAGFAVQSVTPWEYLLTQGNVIIHYLSLIVCPVQQNLDYDFPLARTLFETPALPDGAVLNFVLLPPFLCFLLLGSLVACAVFLARRSSRLAHVVAFCIFMYFIVLSPTSSFVPIIDYIYEHRAYLASVFVITPLVLAIDTLARRVFRAHAATEESLQG